MDPLTHGLIGAAISTFSGTAAGIDNPLTIGAILGAMSPDLDFVIRLVKDDSKYLQHHRGASHSLPYLIVFSVVITTVLAFLPFEGFHILQTFFWTFLGALSHTGMDILNSYGAKFFKKKIKASLLTLYDPIFTAVGLYLIIIESHTRGDYILSLSVISAYMALRWWLKIMTKNRIESHFQMKHGTVQVHIIPALKAFYKWDFVVHTDSHDYVGQFNPFCMIKGTCAITKNLQIFQKVDPRYEFVFRNSSIGRHFSTFSPNLHVKVMEEGEQTILRIVDLRYFFKKDFMHQATMIIDSELNVLSSLMHPYSLKNAIPIY